MHKLNIKFTIGDRVRVPELNLSGRVKSIFISKDCLQYSIRYFNDQKPLDCYFDEQELELVEDAENPKKKLGFK